jgi:hypothetical protein
MEAQGREREREREREEMRRVRGDPLRRRGPGFRVEEELVRLAPMQLGLGGQEKQPPIAAGGWVGRCLSLSLSLSSLSLFVRWDLGAFCLRQFQLQFQFQLQMKESFLKSRSKGDLDVALSACIPQSLIHHLGLGLPHLLGEIAPIPHNNP